MNSAIEPLEVVDSHTGGEPTRVVIAGWPEPAGTTVAERRESMRREHDHLRRMVVLEPRGHDAIVGALLVPPERDEAVTGVVYFNDESWLGMCGHGTIGVVRTLQWLGKISPGKIELDTPVGPVGAVLHDDGSVTIRNVPARVARLDVEVEVPGVGMVTGDVAWGGNWFFLTTPPGLELVNSNRNELLRRANAIREALISNDITGDDGALIDHIEMVEPSPVPGVDSRNFVLCPGAAWDRSPCGTGTSAKLAALDARGLLEPGQVWNQQSIIGSTFSGWIEKRGNEIVPFIRGNAYVTGRSTLLADPDDPFRHGFR